MGTEWRARILRTDAEVAGLLHPAMRIAVVGLKDSGPSFDVAAFMQRQGHTIVPVTPKLPEVLGERAYRTLAEVPGRIDVVDVFRASQRVMPHAEEVLALKERPAVFWMQLGISNEEAAELLARAGVTVVQDRCLKIEWANLYRL
jgi:predicted CoA-binding protein